MTNMDGNIEAKSFQISINHFLSPLIEFIGFLRGKMLLDFGQTNFIFGQPNLHNWLPCFCFVFLAVFIHRVVSFCRDIQIEYRKILRPFEFTDFLRGRMLLEFGQIDFIFGQPNLSWSIAMFLFCFVFLVVFIHGVVSFYRDIQIKHRKILWHLAYFWTFISHLSFTISLSIFNLGKVKLLACSICQIVVTYVD